MFTTFYAPPAQDAFVLHWSRRDLVERPNDVLAWVTEHWRDLPLSGARRTGAFTPTKVVRALSGYAAWLDAGGTGLLDHADFDSAFRGLVAAVPYHGRYTGLKLYEALRRVGEPLPPVTDIRPRGGKTPRKGLALLFDHDPRSNDPDALRQANDLADELRRLAHTTWFNVEMLLCNFTKAVSGGYYPGHALDRDLGRLPAVEAAFGPAVGNTLRHWRGRLYPYRCLGERSGWTGKRPELEKTFVEYGYFWSDLRYDYRATVDFARPVRRDPTLALTPVVGYGEEGVY